MYYDLIYLIPVAMTVFAVWFFYPSLFGRREKKISPGEYAWFILCIVGIPIFGSGLFATGLFLESWYANPRELDIRFLPLVLLPWVVISRSFHGVRHQSDRPVEARMTAGACRSLR